MDIQDPAARTDRQCGKCSLCCKLLHVIELNKPAGQWCEHCKPGHGGCSIHETRPHICRSYFCGWMLTKNVGEEWYPLTCHMVLSLGVFNGINTVTVTVDPNYPSMWKERPYYAQLKQMAYRGLRVTEPKNISLVHVRVSNRVWLIMPDKDIDITSGSYVLKGTARNRWDIEQFKTSDEAAERVATLAPHGGLQISVPS